MDIQLGAEAREDIELTRMKWKSKGSALTTGIRKRGSKHPIQTFNFTEKKIRYLKIKI
jgi:hypothetical protein